MLVYLIGNSAIKMDLAETKMIPVPYIALVNGE